MRAAVDALWSRSVKQQNAFAQSVRTFLVDCYDEIVERASSQEIGHLLRTGTFWGRLFWRSRLRIARSGVEDQLAALQNAFRRPRFLQEAFKVMNSKHGSGADGAKLDRETFIAACLLTCGDASQRWFARSWFHSDHLPSDVLASVYLAKPCQGTQKIRDGLFTLQKMVGQSFCLVFDQLEDTYSDLSKYGQNEAKQIEQLFGNFWRNLSGMSHFCLIFSFQISVWRGFAKTAPPALIDRMNEGNGAQDLMLINDQIAIQIVEKRMRAAIWCTLNIHPPEKQLTYPFTNEDISQIQLGTGGELRKFLQRMQLAYNKAIFK